jgi:hypothetical protein
MKSAPDDMQCSPSPAPVGPLDEYENFVGRHRFGATASDTLRELHRKADLELADEGGIAPQETLSFSTRDVAGKELHVEFRRPGGVVYTHDEDGNIVSYDAPLPDQSVNWGVICFYGALLLVATVALVKLFAEGK